MAGFGKSSIKHLGSATAVLAEMTRHRNKKIAI
jgi:hypothetical protein